jgi:RNA polymerase sigma factor (sigma-70 family)
MSSDETSRRLSRIQTHWTAVFQAHGGQGGAVAEAKQELLLRYHGAVFRYLVAMLRDPVAAEELTQEFAVRFLRGDFRRADPERGRFRDFLKTAVRRLAIDYWQRQAREKQARPLPEESLLAGAASDAGSDEAFLKGWREELLAHAWESLAKFAEGTGSPCHAVLRFKTGHPEAHSAEMAAELGRQLGRTFSEAAMRQALYRARQVFADLLVEEVARSLGQADVERLEQELIELDLLDYCRLALDRRGRPT